MQHHSHAAPACSELGNFEELVLTVHSRLCLAGDDIIYTDGAIYNGMHTLAASIGET